MQNISRHFVCRAVGVEDFSHLGPSDVLALDQYQEQAEQTLATNKRGRKRKLPVGNELEITNIPDLSVLRDAGAVSAESAHLNDEFLGENQSSVMPPPAVIPSFNENIMSNLPMTPGNHLGLGGLTPANLSHGGLTPAGLPHGSGMTPLHLAHGDMTEPNLEPGNMTPASMHHDYTDSGDLHHHSAFTPAGLDHGGGMTPHHGIENLESIPNLPADQVSSILNGTTGMDGFANMGYDDHLAGAQTPRVEAAGGMSERVATDWNDDYDFPQSVAHHVSKTSQKIELACTLLIMICDFIQ